MWGTVNKSLKILNAKTNNDKWRDQVGCPKTQADHIPETLSKTR